MKHSEIIAWAIGRPAPNSVPMNRSYRRIGRLKSVGVLRLTPAAWSNPAELTAHNLRIMRTFLFGTRSFRQINSERQCVPLW